MENRKNWEDKNNKLENWVQMCNIISIFPLPLNGYGVILVLQFKIITPAKVYTVCVIVDVPSSLHLKDMLLT